MVQTFGVWGYMGVDSQGQSLASCGFAWTCTVIWALLVQNFAGSELFSSLLGDWPHLKGIYSAMTVHESLQAIRHCWSCLQPVKAHMPVWGNAETFCCQDILVLRKTLCILSGGLLQAAQRLPQEGCQLAQGNSTLAASISTADRPDQPGNACV